MLVEPRQVEQLAYQVGGARNRLGQALLGIGTLAGVGAPGQHVGLRGQHRHRRAQFVGGILDKGLLPGQLQAQRRQQMVERVYQWLQLRVHGRHGEGREVIGTARGDLLRQLAQRPQRARDGQPQGQ